MNKSKFLKLKKLEPSVAMALLAVVISFGSVIISYKEANIMKEQQLIMKEQQVILSEQQQASVWPYMEHSTFHAYKTDDKQTTVTFTYEITNKGIGPAIIGDVDYFLDNEKLKLSGSDIYKKIKEKYPNIKVNMNRIVAVENSVLSSGETKRLLTIELIKKNDDTTKLNEVINKYNFYLNYCYCSVYGKCWQVKDNETTVKSDKCTSRTDIR